MLAVTVFWLKMTKKSDFCGRMILCSKPPCILSLSGMIKVSPECFPMEMSDKAGKCDETPQRLMSSGWGQKRSFQSRDNTKEALSSCRPPERVKQFSRVWKCHVSSQADFRSMAEIKLTLLWMNRVKILWCEKSCSVFAQGFEPDFNDIESCEAPPNMMPDVAVISKSMDDYSCSLRPCIRVWCSVVQYWPMEGTFKPGAKLDATVIYEAQKSRMETLMPQRCFRGTSSVKPLHNRIAAQYFPKRAGYAFIFGSSRLWSIGNHRVARPCAQRRKS